MRDKAKEYICPDVLNETTCEYTVPIPNLDNKFLNMSKEYLSNERPTSYILGNFMKEAMYELPRTGSYYYIYCILYLI